MPHRLMIVSLLLLLGLSGCGYNSLQVNDEQIKASWGEVLNQYQRRADLVPNLVSVVKGYATHEKDVLTQITEARARVGSIQATPELLNDPQAFSRFQAAQGQLGSALSRLMVVSENYPNLKADGLFRDLQAQLEGTENRITVARRDYNEAVRDYNTSLRTFPTALWAGTFYSGAKPMALFSANAAAQSAPVVDFGSTPGAAPGSAPPITTPPAPAAK